MYSGISLCISSLQYRNVLQKRKVCRSYISHRHEDRCRRRLICGVMYDHICWAGNHLILARQYPDRKWCCCLELGLSQCSAVVVKVNTGKQSCACHEKVS